MRIAIVFGLLVFVFGGAVCCTTDSASETGATGGQPVDGGSSSVVAGAKADGSSGGGGSPQGGANPGGQGPTPSAGASANDGGGGAAASANEGGGGGCDYHCGALAEAQCSADSSCIAIYGEPWKGPHGNQFGGCQTVCCMGADCEAPIVASVCAHPSGDARDCWTFPSGVAPDGWIVLSEVDACDAFPACGLPSK